MQASSIKARLLDIVDSGSEQFDQRDLDRVKNDDRMIQRFIDFHGDAKSEASATDALLDWLRWRRDNQINDLRADQLPKEIFESGRFVIGTDLKSRKFVLDRIGLHRKKSQALLEVQVKFLTYCIEQLGACDECCLYFDVSNAGFSTLDMAMAKKYIELFNRRYPGLGSKVVIFGMSALAGSFIKGVLKMLPERCSKRVEFVQKEEAMDMIGQLKLIAAGDCSDFDREGQKHGMSTKEIDQAKEYWKWVKDNAHK